MSQKGAQSGEERRAIVLKLLQNSKEPLKAAELASGVGVSRQVIVQDVALLRARLYPIIATPGGYMFIATKETAGVRRVVVCCHNSESVEHELNLLVDQGITVVDVGVEHSVYGMILRPLGLKSRKEVSEFVKRLSETDAVLLSSLTDGLHQHTIEGPDEESLDHACSLLSACGYLVD